MTGIRIENAEVYKDGKLLPPPQDTCEILWDWSQAEMESAFGTASRSAPNESLMETDSPAWHAKSECWCWMEIWKHAGCKETGLTKSNVYIYIYIPTSPKAPESKGLAEGTWKRTFAEEPIAIPRFHALRIWQLPHYVDVMGCSMDQHGKISYHQHK